MNEEHLEYIGSNKQYLEYLNSSKWKAKRKAVKERSNNICERCQRYLVDEVHHLTYTRIFNELLEDLLGLCEPCHEFLHGHSGIDPLQPSILIKVSYKIIEYWDNQAKKFRRVSISKLPPENFRWGKMLTSEGLRIYLVDSQLGQYQVPMEVFLDDQGRPVFNPSLWNEFKVASRLRDRWYSNTQTGRPVPPEGYSVEAERADQEKRKHLEQQRLRESPEHFTNFQTNLPKTSKEAIALFKKYPRIIDHGCECTIRNVRATKTIGVVLSLHRTAMRGGWIRYTLPKADHLLAQGRIILDHDRGMWVVKEKHHSDT